MRRRVLLSLVSGTAAALAGCADGMEEANDDDGGTPAATPAADDAAAIPEPQMTVEVPDKRQRGEPFSVRLTAENPADEPQAVSRQVSDVTADVTVGEFSSTLPPGETVVWESPPIVYQTIPDDGVVELDVGGDTVSVRIFEPLSVGASHTYEDGVTIHVEGIQTVRAYPHRIDDRRRWRHAGDGAQYVFVFVSATGVHRDGQVGTPPSKRGLLLRHGGQVFRPQTPRYTPLTGVPVPSEYTIDSWGATPRADVSAYDSVDIRRSALDGEHPDENLYPDAAAAPDETLWLFYEVSTEIPATGLRVLASR
ncbi:uncharacterized protein NP_3728A [Natronomonas pharaonis DSM 2160]|uniref:Uncharacterized protein n=1 Tax=Natronomonas pharaonis (strain ATCC 35678 / DSM 2160 / CIP 103997 / JCM 8858 / NBRC 14720 / NCIMB 2260 / Gabara) TaxID=348780 RepID=A0A1U7EXP9_NATPD|nr:hypothetical protein [Natronomonas pharaonis]CAI49955.2 uncharacterized protein NP_3728A [Natronomonas pharaonis DSM 2160]